LIGAQQGTHAYMYIHPIYLKTNAVTTYCSFRKSCVLDAMTWFALRLFFVQTLGTLWCWKSRQRSEMSTNDIYGYISDILRVFCAYYTTHTL